MNDSPTGTPDATSRKRPAWRWIAVYLIGTFLSRVLTTAHEYPQRGAQPLTIALGGLAITALIALRTQVSRALPRSEENHSAGGGAVDKLQFWVAIAAGRGLFAVRLTSNVNWWTGHLFYEVGRRPVLGQ